MTVTLDPRDIVVEEDRQRSSITESDIEDLADDIEESRLIHAPVVHERRGTYVLIAGERRLRALCRLTERGATFLYGDEEFPPGTAPFQAISDNLEIYDLERIELHENIVRKDLSWQERCRAVARLHKLEKEKRPETTIRDTAATVAGLPPDEAAQSDAKVSEVHRALILDRFLDDPDVARAETPKKALKIAESKTREKEYARKREQREATAATAEAEGWDNLPSLTSPHTFIQGDTHEELGALPSSTFRCIVTDPPYGINISNSHWGRGSQSYSDEEHRAADHYRILAEQGYRVCADEAFIFAFCDPRMFSWLVETFSSEGWDVWPHPLIWDRTPKGLLPVPDFGPRRCYEMILFARKGGAEVANQGRSDVIRIPFNAEHNRPGEKPVELYSELLYRVCQPGDLVLDPFAGTGPLIPAADSLMCEATCIDIDDYAAGACAEQIERCL